LDFYSKGWILELSPVATVVLLALMDLHGKSDEGPYVLLGDRRKRYGISHDSWTKGSKDLRGYNLLDVSRDIRGDDFQYARPRNTYQLKLEFMSSLAPVFS
jgi:hypothetical protein